MNIDEDFRFDVRIQERMVKKGLVTKEELEKRLSSLKDVEQQAEAIDLQQPGVLDTSGEGQRE